VKLSKAYEPKDYEPEIYALWEASGAFAPTGQGDPYSIVMPPPNANGNLHVGHAYMIPIEDILTRYHRMRGYDTVWIPGADHAGFETWVVFEKALEREGKSRFDFSRDELYQMTWDFVAQNRHNMELQLRALGASCDWGALVFTLDPKVVNTVYQTFKKLWDDGLVYRGERIVNYCTVHQTSFADIEIVFKEENSHLWQIAYPLSDGKGEIVVATTRPETMLGDVAVAVHPGDKRYAKLVGKTVKLPLTDREIPIIADEAVEQEFGTGAVKITPAHDPLDFEIGQRHHLENITIIGQDGLITDAAPEKYRGLTVDISREDVIKDLQQQGYLRKTEHYKHQVPHCYKCDSVIQPLLMKQWFINVHPLAERAKKAIESGQIKFVPEQKGRELVRYYDELRDWNISRQIPWGIPIPAFQNVDDPDDWIFDVRVDQAEITVDGKIYRRDEDTFDTWFSSGQWPVITTDYLDQGDSSRFYPTSVMETGVDILRPWVSRMVMLGLYITGKVPFRDVFFHGLILDEHGVKMSKSKGNVINPMDFIDEYGSDALRIGIVMNRSAGQAQAFSTASVVAGRNFCNKLWTIARFIESKGDSIDSGTATTFRAGSGVTTPVATAEPRNDGREDVVRESGGFKGENSPANHWILRQLDNARKTVDKHIKNYRFAEAVETIYHTVWDDLADWFIEASKTNAQPEFLCHVLDITLRLAHPFAPFVTETIWTTLHDDDTLLISQQWPTELSYNKAKAAQFDQIKDLVSEIRLVTTQLPAKKYDLLYQNDPLIAENTDLIQSLANLKTIAQTEQGRGLRLAVADHAAWLDIDEQLLYEHQTRLETRLAAVREEIANLAKRLASSGYAARAPKHLVEETKLQLDDKRALETRLMAELGIV
jgi:valyl-tRNA synthetase